MEITQTLDIAAIERFLRVRGWTLSPDDSQTYISANRRWLVVGDWQVGTMEIRQLVGTHVEGGYYQAVSDEINSLGELEAELVSLGVMPWECPNCGSSAGEPATFTSRPYRYGADADGNRGEMRTDSEQRCTKCVRKP